VRYRVERIPFAKLLAQLIAAFVELFMARGVLLDD
jgi:hypothetical protein